MQRCVLSKGLLHRVCNFLLLLLILCFPVLPLQADIGCLPFEGKDEVLVLLSSPVPEMLRMQSMVWTGLSWTARRYAVPGYMFLCFMLCNCAPRSSSELRYINHARMGCHCNMCCGLCRFRLSLPCKGANDLRTIEVAVVAAIEGGDGVAVVMVVVVVVVEDTVVEVATGVVEVSSC